MKLVNSDRPNPFKIGDRVVCIGEEYRPEYGEKEYTITEIDRNDWCNAEDGNGWHFSQLVPVEVYNSPLYQALKEDE